MKKHLSKFYKFLFVLAPWAILAGMLQYNFQSLIPYQGVFHGKAAFDFITVTDLYICLLVGIFILGYFTKSIKVNHQKLPTELALAVIFLAVAALLQLTFQTTYEPVLSTPIEYLRSLFIFPLIFVQLIYRTLNTKEVRALLASYFAMILAFCAFALLQYFTGIFPGGQADFMGRLVWPYVDYITLEVTSANWVAFFVTPALVLAFTQVNFKAIRKGTPFAILSLLLFLIAAPTLYLTQSYGAYGAAIGAIVLYSFRAFSWKKFLATMLVIFALIGAGFLHQQTTWKYQVLTGGTPYTYDSSAVSRAQIYKMNFHIIKEHTVLGVGLNQYQSYFAETQVDVLGGELNESHTPPHAHNFFMSMWTSLGVFGFLAMLILVLGILWRTKVRAVSPAVFPLLAIMAHGLIDSYYWQQEIAYLFWFIVILCYLYKPSIHKK